MYIYTYIHIYIFIYMYVYIYVKYISQQKNCQMAKAYPVAIPSQMVKLLRYCDSKYEPQYRRHKQRFTIDNRSHGKIATD